MDLVRGERREPGLDDRDLLVDLGDGLRRVDAGDRHQLPQQALPVRQDILERIAVAQLHITFDDQFNGKRHRTLKTRVALPGRENSPIAPWRERDPASTLTNKANAPVSTSLEGTPKAQ